MPVLLIRMAGRPVMKYEMTEDLVTVGRTRGNTVVLAGDNGVSGTHCRIRKSGNGFVVEDAGSSNGTRLNGKPVGTDSVGLCTGDKIGVGATAIIFDDPLSPRRGWLARVLSGFGGGTGQDAAARKAAPGTTAFGEGYVICGACGAKIHTGNKGPGQKVGCGHCRSIHVIPPKNR
jgi:pSer/pThr/pTyr-binding forkhead associated (FHA) protein